MARVKSCAGAPDNSFCNPASLPCCNPATACMYEYDSANGETTAICGES